MLKFLRIVTIGGSAYCLIELIYRLLTNPSSISRTQSLSMFIVGGLCIYIVGLLNELFKMKIIYQSIIGTLLILFIEFIMGYILNIKLKLNIWNYDDIKFNIMGQVSVLFSFAWMLLTPLAFWLDDKVRRVFYNEEEVGSLFSYYKRLFTLK